MRRLIRADIRRILKKRSVIILFFLMLLYLCLIVIGSYPAFDQDPLVPVKELMSHTRMPELVLGLVILFGVYADDFRSMTYTCVIGRGLTRSKLVLAKLLDTVILAALMYGIITLVLTVGLKFVGCSFSPRLSRAFYMTILITVYKTVGYIALSSMILYITNNIPLTTISLLLLYIAVPFSALLFSLNAQVKAGQSPSHRAAPLCRSRRLRIQRLPVRFCRHGNRQAHPRPAGLSGAGAVCDRENL